MTQGSDYGTRRYGCLFVSSHAFVVLRWLMSADFVCSHYGCAVTDT